LATGIQGPVMSSRLCKNLEGAVFPFQVEFLEDGNDAVHTSHIDETNQVRRVATRHRPWFMVEIVNHGPSPSQFSQ
jgi:hypothetical protein